MCRRRTWPRFSAPYTVDDAGMLNLPYIGNIKAGGLAPSQVQVAIQQKLHRGRHLHQPHRHGGSAPPGQRFVVVGGAVRAPGRVPYTADLTLMSAINGRRRPQRFRGGQDPAGPRRQGRVLQPEAALQGPAPRIPGSIPGTRSKSSRACGRSEEEGSLNYFLTPSFFSLLILIVFVILLSLI